MTTRQFSTSILPMFLGSAFATPVVALPLIDFEDQADFTFIDDEYRNLMAVFEYPRVALRAGEVMQK